MLAPLALAFFPILASAGAIAGAEERGTIDVLLGNPIRRWHLVVGSFVCHGGLAALHRRRLRAS